jgi:glyoxylase-like metal-dependent hydrolase (beta-lactamase superfamily II)
MEELRPGLFRWTTRHPEWTPEEGGPDGWDPVVASYLYESADGVLLFDPLLADDSPDWDALSARVQRHGPPHVLLTLFWHVRSTPAVAARYQGTRVWAHDRAPWIDETRKRVQVTDAFDLEDTLPAGVQALEPREVVYWLPEHRALVAGDVLLGTPDGGVRPTPWLGEHMTAEDLQRNLRPLLDLPIELLLLTHGEAVLENARSALARALEVD